MPDAAASRAMEDFLLDATQRLVRNVEYASQIIAFAFVFVDSRVVARGMNQIWNTFQRLIAGNASTPAIWVGNVNSHSFFASFLLAFFL